MKVSAYTSVKNGIKLDYHVKHTIQHNAPLFDEFIINYGRSNDGTDAAIEAGIRAAGTNNITVLETTWTDSGDNQWWLDHKNIGKNACTGDWCVLIDMDELIPEWEIHKLYSFLWKNPDGIFGFHYNHFVGSYLTKEINFYQPLLVSSGPNWPEYQYRIHPNINTCYLTGDGANIEGLPWRYYPNVEVFHYGTVRNLKALSEKWHIQGERNYGEALNATKQVEQETHPEITWDDPRFTLDKIEIYNGPQPWVVANYPSEFIRDNFYLYNKLKKAIDEQTKS